MNRRFLTFAVSTSLGLALTLVILSHQANAGTRRSCNAYYEVQIFALNGAPHHKTLKFGEFYATGSCGRLVPNKCRRKARDRAHACMQKHWESRHGDRPQECSLSHDVSNYDIVKLIPELPRHICFGWHIDEGDWVDFHLYGVTTGDKGCGPDKEKIRRVSLTGDRHVHFQCTAQICGGPCGE